MSLTLFHSSHARTRSLRRLSLLLLSLCLGTASEAAAQGSTPSTAGPAPEGPKLTKPPALTKFVEAPYPTVEPKPTGDVGVTLTILIDALGKVGEAQVTESGGAAFDAAALAAVQAFEFSPAEIDGKPAAIRIVYRYVFTLREEKVVPTTGVLSGTVLDADTKKPLPNVKVELPGGVSVTTDEKGHFRLENLAPGKLPITLSGERLTPLQTEETVVVGEELDVTYKVALQPPPGAEQGPSDDMEILVTAPPALKREVVSTKVSAEQARSIPGAQGDVVRVVENLPGVARSAVGSGQLVVWGAGPEDTRTYVDGVPIPRLYHEGGLRSTVHSSMVSSVELVPGGYGAAYGRGLGGLVRIDTKTPDKQGLHGLLAADVFDASAMMSTSLGKQTDVAAAGRVSVIDQLAKGLDDDVGKFVPIPRYRDAQLRIARDLGDGQRVEVVGLMSLDHTARGVPNPDPSLVTREARDLSFYRLYARYVAERGNGTRTVVTPYVGFGSQSQKSSYGATVTSLSTDDYVVGLRASHAIRLNAWISLEGGLDAEVANYKIDRRGSLGLPPREGDVRVFGQPPPDQIGFDDFSTTRVGIAPYAEADITPFGEKLHIVPGLRVDPNFRSVSKRTPVIGDSPPVGAFEQNFVAEPRLALRWAVLERLTLHTAAGLYHQQPAAADLSSTFGNPLLPTSRAWHFVAGAALQPLEKLTVELTGFATFLDQLTMRNGLASPLVAQALLPTGQGRTVGLQTLIRKDMSDHFFGWIAYTIMRSERKNDDNSDWRLFDYDQTHVLSTVLVWSPLKGFELGGRFRVASGYPRTKVTGTYYDALRNREQPFFGEHNGIRIPMFMQLDVRVSQTFKLGTSELQAYLEVQNITNRANTEEYVYSPDFTRRGKIQSLPILPVAGVQWTF
ncbi:MAG: TonB-dependent receptor [Myxococcales bacterium]